MVGLSNMTNFDHSIPNYAAEMDRFRRSDEEREMLLRDLITRYGKLEEAYSDIQLEANNDKRSRIQYQKELDQTTQQLKTIQNRYMAMQENSSFVLGLIDGDGVIFQDALLMAGAHGGSEAASKLQRAIRDHIAQIYPNSGHWSIMVNVYVSLDKLGQKLQQVGLLNTVQDMRAFAQSFNVNQPLFNIIDVGYGKERADHKIKEMLRTFSQNPTCKHILFGGCHDAGYLLNLEQFRHNQEMAANITLLETTYPARGFSDLVYIRRTRFDGVFRSDPLPDAPPPAPMKTTLAHSTTSPVISSPPPAPVAPAKVASAQVVAAKTIPTPAVASPIFVASSNSGPPTEASSDSTPTWSTVSKAGAPNGTIAVSKNTSKNAKNKKRYVYYNKDGYRLDEPLPTRDRAAAEAIDRRMEKGGRNLCNHYHLNKGKCNEGEFCKFQHGPKLTPAEIVALTYKTRSLPCKRRDCENFHCYLGHQCSQERDIGYCQYGSSCHLKASHGMDKVKFEAWDEDENVVYAAQS